MEILTKVLSVLFGAIIGFLVYKASSRSEISGLLCILIGLVGTSVINSLVEFSLQARELRKITAFLSNLLLKIGKCDQAGREFQKVLRYGVSTFKREQIPNTWIELLWGLENRYYGLSYSDPELWWSQAFTKLAIEIQKTKITVNKADIRRIFIYDDEAEKSRIQDIMREQSQAGIMVKHISRQHIDNHYLLKQLADKLETLDYALIDSKIAWLVVVDKNRKFKLGKALIDDTIIENYQNFFDHLFQEAEKFAV